MNLKDMFNSLVGLFSHHADTGALHGDSGAIKTFLGEVADRISKLEEAPGVLLGDAEKMVMDEIAALRESLVGIEKRVADIEKAAEDAIDKALADIKSALVDRIAEVEKTANDTALKLATADRAAARGGDAG